MAVSQNMSLNRRRAVKLCRDIYSGKSPFTAIKYGGQKTVTAENVAVIQIAPKLNTAGESPFTIYIISVSQNSLLNM
jgi:hypothetical protein